MRRAFVVVSTITLIVFAFQFVFAAVGAFTEPPSDSAYALHGVTGMAVIPALTLLTTLSAVLARAPGRLVALAILPLGLTLLQALLAALPKAFADESGSSTVVGLIFGALHAVNGIVAVHVVVNVVRGASRLASHSPSDPVPTEPASPGTPERASSDIPEPASPGTSARPSSDSPERPSPDTPEPASPSTSARASSAISERASFGTPVRASPGIPESATPGAAGAASSGATGRGEAT